MSGRRILAALALVLASALCLLVSRGARRPGAAAPPRAEPSDEAVPAEVLAAPATIAPDAPRREAEPSAKAVAGSAAPAGEPPRTIEFLVTDRARNPLAGARIRVAPGYQQEPVADVTTGADGRVRIERPAERSCFLLVERDGYVHLQEYFEPAELVTRGLPRAVRLAGRVLDAATRAPLAGARVSRGHDACRFCEPDEAVTDDDGRYELAGVPVASGDDAPRFLVEAAGHPTRSERIDTSAAVDRLAHDFVLERGLTLSGRVLGFPGRTPLDGASVHVDGQWFATDALGHFQGPVGDAPGELRLWVRAKEHCTMLVDVARERAHHPIEILLPRTCALEGTVRDRLGAPVPEAHVGAGVVSQSERAAREGISVPEVGLPENHRFVVSEDGPSGKTDAEGRFRLAGLPPVAEAFVYARAEGFQQLRSRLEVSLRCGATERIDLTLEALGCTGTIRGRLTLNGEPTSCTVRWKGRTRDGYAWTRDDRYELREVECGPVEVQVRLDAPDTRADLTVEAGSVVEHDFDLRRSAARIVGHVRFERGEPAAGISIHVHHPTLRISYQVESDAEGAYSCEVVPHAEPYRVTIVSAGDSHGREDALANGPPVDFVLPELAQLRFRTQDAESGAAIEESSISWRRPGETSFKLAGHLVPADSEGWRTVSVPGGKLELLARADALGYRAARAANVEAGGPGGVTLALERGGSVRFELARECEAFPADHVLYLIEADVAVGVRTNPRACDSGFDPTGFYPRGALQHRLLRFSSDGAASLQGIDPGVHRFVVCPDGLWIEPAELRVEGEAGEAIPIRWGRR